MNAVRLDKWLWAVRLFKTRAKATNYCRLGKVKINGALAKASREISVGDVIDIKYNEYTRSVRVKELLKNRVGAKLVEIYAEDITAEAELEKLKIHRSMKTEFRPRGMGRPTKKERRIIDGFKGFD